MDEIGKPPREEEAVLLAESRDKYNVPRGTAVLTTQQVITYPAAFLFYLFAARILSNSEIGQISLLSAALAIFGTLTQIALPVAATQFISSSIGRKDTSTAGAIAKTSLRLLALVSIPGLLVSILISPLIGGPVLGSSNAPTLLVVTFIAGFLLDLVALYGGWLLGLGLYSERAYQFMLYVPVSRGLGIALAYRFGVLGVVIGWAIGAAAALVLSLYFWRGRLSSSSSYPARPLLRFSFPVFLAGLITFAQGYGDIALLQAIRGQLGTTGAYFLIVSSVGGIGLSTVGVLSIIWTSVSAALYPALSFVHTTKGPSAVSAKLDVAFSLTNKTVLPLGAALAAIAPTVLYLAYGRSYAVEAVPFAILSLTTVFASQATLLTTGLQAVGKTRPFFTVTLAATIADLTVVLLTANTLGTTGAALGRGVLAIATVLLARRALGPIMSRSTFNSLGKAVLLATGVGVPMFLADQLSVGLIHLTPLERLPLLLAVSIVSFLVSGRTLSTFSHRDFFLIKRALPRAFHGFFSVIERIMIR